jgi:hypothetical protein
MVNIFTHKKETKDFHLISFGKFGYKMRPKPLSWDDWCEGVVFQLVMTLRIPSSSAASWSIVT